ncbi:hypothetical protein [Magnetovibrio sp.]|uniref:hypothetical protein n=1 Tax=Magnetovibrio sp. TaxID=2024836 RepID=UPI002F9490FF
MDISQYRTESLLALREPTRELAKAPISPVKAIGDDRPQLSAENGTSLFDTLLDTVNPLQHIPGVSQAYRAVSGDESSALANMAGGFLFGGPVGLAAGAASSFFEMLTGKDLLGHAMAFFEGDSAPSGIQNLETAAAQDTESLIKPYGTSLSLENYQAFATAKDAQQLGIGATATAVGWAENIWTDKALKEATGIYDNSQNLGEQTKRHNEAIA